MLPLFHNDNDDDNNQNHSQHHSCSQSCTKPFVLGFVVAGVVVVDVVVVVVVVAVMAVMVVMVVMVVVACVVSGVVVGCVDAAAKVAPARVKLEVAQGFFFFVLNLLILITLEPFLEHLLLIHFYHLPLIILSPLFVVPCVSALYHQAEGTVLKSYVAAALWSISLYKSFIAPSYISWRTLATNTQSL